ncbi:FMN-binding protein [Ruminococcaceae bacterium OttesenSCG-928-D13]|nr:FMN-binding protein [Ruminococcaceae bacterium OttesenSCG-928-D13]
MADKPDLSSGLEEMERMEQLLEASEAGESPAEAIETEPAETAPDTDLPEAPAPETADGDTAQPDEAEASEPAGDEPPAPAEAEPTKAKPDDVDSHGKTVYKSKAPPKPPKTKEVLEYEKAKRDHFRQTVWQPFLSPIIALVSICLVTSLLLGLTNSLTAPLIEANAASEAAAARRELLPEADDFTPMDLEGLPDSVTAMYAANNGTGWVVESYGRGYGGKVPAMVAFDADGTITGVTFPANDETPGLGQNLVGNANFASQFNDRPAQNISSGEIDKIASATITTNAAVSAVNAAVEAYSIKVEGATGPATDPAEIRAQLLPGESLTPVTVDAPNVQPEAFVSDAGNYIIYGEKPPESEYSGVVVAAVAIDDQGVILNLWIDTSGEGEQYGQTLATNRQFLDSFIGHSAPVVVDAVADITNSSRSVMEAVNNALNAWPLVKGVE